MRIGLTALLLAAAASPSSAVIVLYDFESGMAAQGWSSTTAGNGLTFLDLPGLGDANYVNNSLNAPIANSDLLGSGFGAAFDISLSSPPQAFVGAATLSYQINFQVFSGLDKVEVYYGATLVHTHNTDTPVGGLYVLNVGVGFSHNVTAATGDVVRFRYSSTDSGAWEWYAQVDNVRIEGVPAPASVALLGLGTVVACRRRRRA